MRLRELKQAMYLVPTFSDPEIMLEQYITPPDIAAHVLYTAEQSFGDIDGKSVLDLGCGTGMLSIGCSLLGASLVVGVDISSAALRVAKDSTDEEELPVQFIQHDILSNNHLFRDNIVFDTVVMNPPFGTRRHGSDIGFLEAGINLCSGAVYSLHKRSTRKHIQKKAKSWGVMCTVVAEVRYNIDQSYSFHKRKSVDIEVDCLRFEKN